MTPVSKPSTAARTLYPADPAILRASLSSLFLPTQPLVSSVNLRALIVPHDAWQYMGTISALSYAQLSPHPNQHIVFIAPAVHSHISTLITDTHTSWTTPLGRIRHRMMQTPTTLIQPDDRPFLKETSIDVQLPFLQYHTTTPSISSFLFPQTSTHITEIVSYFVAHFPQSIFIVCSNLSSHEMNESVISTDQTTIHSILFGDMDYFAQKHPPVTNPLGIQFLLQLSAGCGLKPQLLTYDSTFISEEKVFRGYVGVGFVD